MERQAEFGSFRFVRMHTLSTRSSTNANEAL
jgi:hypothetical protein